SRRQLRNGQRGRRCDKGECSMMDRMMDRIQTFDPAVAAPGGGDLIEVLAHKRRSQLRIIAERFLRNRASVAGRVVLLLRSVGAVFAPSVGHTTLRDDPNIDPDIFNANHGPSLLHPLGTDYVGRDMLARILYGGRVSLLVGISTALLSTVAGLGIGAIAGYYGRWLDGALMRVPDIFRSGPLLLS